MLKKTKILDVLVYVQLFICICSFGFGTYAVWYYNDLLSKMRFYSPAQCSTFPNDYLYAQVKGIIRCLSRSDAIRWSESNKAAEIAAAVGFIALFVPGLIRRDFSAYLD
jgi:hypothetical protein